ncbi:MAG: hypothetical protein U1E81_13685 [Xanthobacteraceae bacterium]
MSNPTFQADALWGNRYVLPPTDRFFDSRGVDVTGLPLPGQVTRVMSSVANWSPSSNLTVDAGVDLVLASMLGKGDVELSAGASTRFSVPWSGGGELAADSSVVTP